MDPHEQFLTEEFCRYSAECRRLARLAAQATERRHASGIGAVAYRRWIEWLDEVSERYFESADATGRSLPVRRTHR